MYCCDLQTNSITHTCYIFTFATLAEPRRIRTVYWTLLKQHMRHTSNFNHTITYSTTHTLHTTHRGKFRVWNKIIWVSGKQQESSVTLATRSCAKSANQDGMTECWRLTLKRKPYDSSIWRTVWHHLKSSVWWPLFCRLLQFNTYYICIFLHFLLFF